MSSDGGKKLVRMANQIAENFDYGDRDKAVDGVLDHLTRFWTADMKRTIIEHHRSGEAGLNEIASRAVAGLTQQTGQLA